MQCPFLHNMYILYIYYQTIESDREIPGLKVRILNATIIHRIKNYTMFK